MYTANWISKLEAKAGYDTSITKFDSKSFTLGLTCVARSWFSLFDDFNPPHHRLPIESSQKGGFSYINLLQYLCLYLFLILL